jgi:hypothetical protein
VDGTKTARMAIDPNVKRRIGKHHCSVFPTHQPHGDIVVPGIAAQNAMGAQALQIADLADTRPRRQFGQGIGGIVSLLG